MWEISGAKIILPGFGEVQMLPKNIWWRKQSDGHTCKIKIYKYRPGDLFFRLKIIFLGSLLDKKWQIKAPWIIC